MFEKCLTEIGQTLDYLNDAEKKAFLNDLSEFAVKWKSNVQSIDRPNDDELKNMRAYKCNGDNVARVTVIKSIRNRCCNGSLSQAVAVYNDWYEKLKPTL